MADIEINEPTSVLKSVVARFSFIDPPLES